MPTSGWIDDQGNPVEIPEDLEELVESAVHFGESIEKHLQQHSVRSRPDKTGQELLDGYFAIDLNKGEIKWRNEALAYTDTANKERMKAIVASDIVTHQKDVQDKFWTSTEQFKELGRKTANTVIFATVATVILFELAFHLVIRFALHA